MKKPYIIRVSLLLLLLLPNLAKSQTFECTLDQTVVGSNLEISMYIRSTGTVAPALGDCRFSVNLDSTALDIASAVLITSGIWTSHSMGNDYNVLTISSSAAEGWVSNNISIKNGNRTGILIPDTATLIGTISIPISNAANIDATWRLSGPNGLVDVHNAAGTDITGNGTFTNPPNFSLPVELVSFTVSKEDNDALLNWVTASEKDNSHFEIERSGNGSEWIMVGNVSGHGNTVERQVYNFTDFNVYNGEGSQTYYYRLRQVDYNGEFKFSPVQVLSFSAKEHLPSISLGPNPATDKVQIFLEGYNGRFTVILINSSGIVLGSYIGIGSHLIVPVMDLGAGNYSVMVNSSSGEVLKVGRLMIKR